jgi:3-dehydroquinate dehydratase-1
MRYVMKRSQIVAVLGEGAANDLKAASGADMIELRLDLSTEPIQTIKAIREATEKPIIATNRLQAEGGRFLGSERERIELLVQASEYADLVDIELQAELREDFISQVSRPVIVSYHDFQGMPGIDELAAIKESMKMAGASIAKIAVTPRSLKDDLDLLEFLLAADLPLCLIAMGDLGRHLRAVAPLYGSALAYGYVRESTAPGQMSLAELSSARELLKW